MNIQHMLCLVILLASSIAGAPSSPCDPNPCQNGGSCMYEYYWPPPHYQCECMGSWTGPDCSQKNPMDTLTNEGSTEELQNLEVQEMAMAQQVPNDNTGNLQTMAQKKPTLTIVIVPGEEADPAEGSGSDSKHEESEESEEESGSTDPCSKKQCHYLGRCRAVANVQGEQECACNQGWLGQQCEIKDLCPESFLSTNRWERRHPDDPNCVCKLGWMGDNCDVRDPCEGKNKTEGKWRHVMNMRNKLVCQCQPGWVGKKCNNRDPCLRNPCTNGGTCSIINQKYWKYGNIRKYNCQCPEGWGGQNCDQDENECRRYSRKNKCVNGFCQNIPGSYNCICHPGWSGKFCNIVDCSSFVCFNNGTCKEVATGNEKKPNCDCNHGYNGDHCEVDLVKQSQEKIIQLETELQTCNAIKDRESQDMEEERRTLKKFVSIVSEEMDNLPANYRSIGSSSSSRSTGYPGYPLTPYWPGPEGSGSDFYG